jgi:hypothetical protein
MTPTSISWATPFGSLDRGSGVGPFAGKLQHCLRGHGCLGRLPVEGFRMDNFKFGIFILW